jgi:hypothetical protein
MLGSAVHERRLDSHVEPHPDPAAEIRAVIAGVEGLAASIPAVAWNADRLNGYLRVLDVAIAAHVWSDTVYSKTRSAAET